MSKGRITPPRPAPLPQWTQDQVTAHMMAHPALYITNVRHDAGCPTIHTQRGADCRCAPETYLLDSEWRPIAQIVDAGRN